MRILLAGGSGFVGRAVAQAFRAAGHQLTIVSRRAGSTDSLRWEELTADVLSQYEGVINLAGEGIASGFWTTAKKAAILHSRLNATNTLVRRMQEAAKHGHCPAWLINASAIGYYGTAAEQTFNEQSQCGEGFLADVCRRWEAAAQAAESFGVRVVILRFGHVLEQDGGLLARLALPFQWHVGGYIGSGRQWMSWIHRADLVAMMVEASGNEQWQGIYNACAPEPVRMMELARGIGAALQRRCWTRLPESALRVAAGELADEVLLAGQRVLPLRTQEQGFVFRFPKLPAALAAIYSGGQAALRGRKVER